MLAIGATCFVLYQLLNGRAYRSGDLSVVYPLTQTSIIYVPIWGMTLLGERPSPWLWVSLVLLIGSLVVLAGSRRKTATE